MKVSMTGQEKDDLFQQYQLNDLSPQLIEHKKVKN
jgi:hypothetical protein